MTAVAPTDVSAADPRLDRPFRRVAVVGCGLVGGSFALATQRLPETKRVVVVDADESVLAEARALGVGTAWSVEPAAVATARLVVLAVPVTAMVGVARTLVPHLRDDAIVTDVGSVKGRLVHELRAVLGERYLGGHPMAGSERSGVGAAQATLFQGATWLLTPDADAAPTPLTQTAFHRVAAHLRAIGARVLAVPADLHDELVAIASHLPQALASLLMAVASDAAQVSGQGLLQVTAGGFRDVTRVAASDPDLWVGILRENRAAFLRSLDAFAARLGGLRAAVEAGDWGVVHRELDHARQARRALPRREVQDVLVDLVVPIPDRPGALAEVTTALGTAGINIEDLSMRHSSRGDRGAMIIAVDGHARADAAMLLLAERGYEAHPEVRG